MISVEETEALLLQGELTEADCLAIINGAGNENGPIDAFDLILMKMPTADRRFKNVDRAIRKLLADVQEVFPDAQYYTASGGFNLMLGSPHDASRNLRSQQELVALCGEAMIGDGDF